jgi:endonuclease/exonuclease/phosphatase family metal-dependent hydrolase
MPIVSHLSPVPSSLFVRAAEGEATDERHRSLAAEIEALSEVELRQAATDAATSLRRPLRLAAWNLERCKHVEASASVLARAGCDVALLSEMDLGMARSGNRHTTRDLADSLADGTGYAFATEFIEIGLGNQTETAEHAGQSNTRGLHGNAIVSRLPLGDIALIPLEPHGGGTWWNLDWHHRRIGGRLALASTVEVRGRPVYLVSAHLESLPGPERREAQVRRILEHLDETIGDRGPAVIAGDFNTANLPRKGDRGWSGAGADEEPAWFDDPRPYEGMFAALADAGFDWSTANTPEPTRRILANGRPEPPFNRLDWFFVRGLRASNPKVWPAVDTDGSALSDHELITIDVDLD